MVELTEQFRQQSYWCVSKPQNIDLQTNQAHPNNGMFVSNCAHHVSHNNPAVWGDLQAISTQSFSHSLLESGEGSVYL